MIKLLIAFLLLSHTAFADINFQSAQDSVYKVYKMDADEEPHMVATAFSLEYQNNTYMITNNHVCSALGGPGGAYVKIINGPSKELKTDYDEITHASMTPNSDVCVMQTKHKHKGLKLSQIPTSLYQVLTVFGYLGRSDFSMITQGRLYGTEEVEDFAGFRNCKNNPPFGGLQRFFCMKYSKYPILSKSIVNMATVNVGPGFSGSPVLDQNGDVVGIISRYMPPSKIYGNGDGILYPSSYIVNAIKDAKFISIKSEAFNKDVKIWELFIKLNDTINAFVSFIVKILPGVFS